jgi:hypothetical protein
MPSVSSRTKIIENVPKDVIYPKYCLHTYIICDPPISLPVRVTRLIFQIVAQNVEQPIIYQN